MGPRRQTRWQQVPYIAPMLWDHSFPAQETGQPHPRVKEPWKPEQGSASGTLYICRASQFEAYVAVGTGMAPGRDKL